jgi:hypothetical protein
LRIIVFIATLLFATGCATRIPTASIKEQSETLRVQLMRTESEVYGDFHTLRTFHTDLFQSINRSDAAPYPALDTLFDRLFAEANRAVGMRVNYDTTYWALQQAINGKKKIAMSEPFLSLFKKFEPMSAALPKEQTDYKERYFALRASYQDSCRKYSIVRYNPQDYAALLDGELTQWQDSLEEIGRMVARCKVDLKQRFPAQKGKDFFAAYAPVSELEAMMKNFESILNQFQNSLSRFEEGNSQDFIYFGPYIRQRLEVAANDDLIGQLSLQMKDCRNAVGNYFRGNSK